MKRWYADAFAKRTGSEEGEVIGGVDVGELHRVDSDNPDPELVERGVEGEFARGEPAFKRGER